MTSFIVSKDRVLSAVERATCAVEEACQVPRPYHDAQMVQYLGLPAEWVDGPEKIMTQGEAEMMRVVSSTSFP